MKSIKSPVKKKKYLIVALAALIVVVSSFVAYGAVTKTGPFTETPDDSNVDYQPPTDEQKEAGDETSNEAKDPEETLPEKPSDENPGTPEMPAANVTITAASQNGNTLQIRATISTLKTGTCTLTLSRPGSTTVTKTAPTQPLSNTSTCQGFNIPVSGMTKGEWQLTVAFSGSNINGSASKSVTIQ